MNQFKHIVRTLLRFTTQNTFARTTLLGLARANLLPKFIWQRLPVERTFLVPCADRKSFKYSAAYNDLIGRALFWRGITSWEPETSQVFYKLAQKSKLVLDIGANTGVFTLLALTANSNSRVISFEPIPNVYELLVSNVKANGWEGRCQTKNQAVSNQVGKAKFHVPS